jgi:hypothetical protein
VPVAAAGVEGAVQRRAPALPALRQDLAVGEHPRRARGEPARVPLRRAGRRAVRVLRDARTREELAAVEGFEPDELDRALAGFVERDLVLCLDGKYLALALPDNPNH